MALREQMIQTIVSELNKEPASKYGRYTNFVQYLYELFNGPCSSRAERRKALMVEFHTTDPWERFDDAQLLQIYDTFSINRWKQR